MTLAWNRADARFAAEGRLAAKTRALALALAGGVLALENFAIFAAHYRGVFGFPWDFNGTYFGVPAFWTSAVTRGVLPRWIPFAGGGYPFALNLQSGFFYPPFWVFPALGIHFTLHAAVVLQCLHVLFGALGMYLLLRLVVESPRTALLGAAAYQLFGGFYSNAEHADIVRAFALLPWLLFALTRRGEDGPGLPARALFLPLFVYLLATGGYPFNFLAALFVGTIYGSVEILQQPAGPRTARLLARLASAYFLLACVGAGMAAAALAPAWLHRQELARWHDYGSLPSTGIGIAQLPGLVFRSSAIPGELSMTSSYVSLPLLVAAVMLSWKEARRRAGFLALLAAGGSMAAGVESPVYRTVTGLIPPLGFSRFPASDYRAFTAIALIALGAAALEQASRAGISRRRFVAGAAGAVAAMAAFSASVRASVGIFGYLQAWGIFATSLVLLAVAASRDPRRTRLVGILAFALVFADGARFLLRQPGWWVRDPKQFLPPLARTGGDMVEASVFEPGAFRPARVSSPAGNYTASGYLLGEFGVYEVETAVLKEKRLADEKDFFCEYLRRSWEPHVFPVSEGRRRGQDFLLAEDFPAEPPAPSARLLSQGLRAMRYAIDLAEPSLLVENELFFDGWTAQIEGKPGRIPAVRVDGIFRSWFLPAGRYRMTASFHLPGHRSLALGSVAAACLWGALLSLRFSRRRSA